MQNEQNTQKAINIFQAQGGVLDENKYGYGKLASYGAGPCCIVAAFCPETKRIFLSHIDSSKYINDVCNKINYWVRDNEKQSVEIHLLSGQGKWEELPKTITERIPNHQIKTQRFCQEQFCERFMIDTNGKFTRDFEIHQTVDLGSLESANMTAICNVTSDKKNLLITLCIDEKNHDINKRPLEAQPKEWQSSLNSLKIQEKPNNNFVKGIKEKKEDKVKKESWWKKLCCNNKSTVNVYQR